MITVARKRSLGEVMFSQYLSIHRGGGRYPGLMERYPSPLTSDVGVYVYPPHPRHGHQALGPPTGLSYITTLLGKDLLLFSFTQAVFSRRKPQQLCLPSNYYSHSHVDLQFGNNNMSSVYFLENIRKNLYYRLHQIVSHSFWNNVCSIFTHLSKYKVPLPSLVSSIWHFYCNYHI